MCYGVFSLDELFLSVGGGDQNKDNCDWRGVCCWDVVWGGRMRVVGMRRNRRKTSEKKNQEGQKSALARLGPTWEGGWAWGR